jgi:lipopolysaccharide/colanic/teichoic acid biosynthesis glycosyltransferase
MNVNMLNIPYKKEPHSLSDNATFSNYSPFKYMQKRAIDYLFSFLLMLVSLPIVLYVVYRIKKESPGPIFFEQTRVGLNGETFTCYKFRSMHIHTPTKEGLYTQENDLRIFPFGQFMRKTRIDELPQILNILKGEMHLIGPRAEWDVLSNQYEKELEDYKKRHAVKPGITGLAQVSYPYGRNIYDTEQKLGYDLEYIKNWSLAVEMKVVFQTVAVVLGKKGV